MIQVLRPILTFFKHSAAAKNALGALNSAAEVSKGLVSIGKTRFSSVVWSALSVLRCFDSIQKLVDNGLKIDGLGDMKDLLSKSTKSIEFKLALTKFCGLTQPIAFALKCLEDSNLNPADLMLFWVAAGASVFEFISTEAFPAPVRASIIKITNARFNEMVNKAPSDVYLATFFLHPRKPTSQYCALELD